MNLVLNFIYSTNAEVIGKKTFKMRLKNKLNCKEHK